MLLNRSQIAWMAAQDLWNGAYVNLGIGLPTLVSRFIPVDREVILHSENGMLGFGLRAGEETDNSDVVDAGEERVTLLPGGAFFDHNLAFQMIQGGHLDLALLGCFEVSRAGDLASWSLGDPALPPAVGGAMDLAIGSKSVWVLTRTQTADGRKRIVETCSLPLTASGVVKRIYSDIGIFEVVRSELLVRALPSGETLETVKEALGFRVPPSKDMRKIDVPALP